MAGRQPAFIECEQAIYGSFPFWDKGYALLATSPGCQPAWCDQFINLCRSLGQPPGEANPAIDSLLFASPVSLGHWVIALGSAQGCDDRGRPGAWAFHALFLSNADYRRAGASPFAFEPYLHKKFQKDFSIRRIAIEISTLKSHSVENRQFPINPAILTALHKSRKLRIIDENTSISRFGQFWCQLNEKKRLVHSMATMSFRHNPDFDIAAIKPAAWPSDLPANQHETLAVTSQDIFAPAQNNRKRSIQEFHLPKWLFKFNSKQIAISILVFVLCLIGFINCNFNSIKTSDETVNTQKSISNQPPDASRFQEWQEKPDLKHAVLEGLIDISERLHLDIDAAGHSADEIATRVVAAMRYQGPFINQKIDMLEPAGQQAAKMDDAIRRFSEMKPWPTNKPFNPSARLAMANLAWAAGATGLTGKALNIQSRSDVQEWFDQFSRTIVPDDIEQLLLPTGMEKEMPELVEYRLHLIRISKIANKE